MKKKQTRQCANWQKKANFFVETPLSGNICGNVDPDGAALLLLRCCCQRRRPLAVMCAEVAVAERLAAAVSRLAAELKRPLRVVELPELTRGKLVMPTGENARAKALLAVLEKRYDLIIGSVHAFVAPAPPPEQTQDEVLTLTVGQSIKFDDLINHLLKLDYDDEFEVTIPGEFARRGGIIDVYSGEYDYPCRLEFWGDTIDAMHRFSPENQRSQGKLDSYRIIGRANAKTNDNGQREADFFDYLGEDACLVQLAKDECFEHLQQFGADCEVERMHEQSRKFGDSSRRIDLYTDDRATGDVGGVYLPLAQLEQSDLPKIGAGAVDLWRNTLSEQIRQWLATGYQVVLLARNAEGIAPLAEYARTMGLESANLFIECGVLFCGLLLPSQKLVVLTENELLSVRNQTSGIDSTPDAPLNQEIGSRAMDFSFADLDEGDYVVHIQHGIGIFRAIKTVRRNGFEQELIELEYYDNTRMMIPVSQANRLSRYFGAPGKVKLSRLNTKKWDFEKLAAQQSIRSYAAGLLRVQAVRQIVDGIAFKPDVVAEKLFLSSFPFTDTPDQKQVTDEIYRDMADHRPMDRLLCGDVGYGKTELAMRAVFRAVNNNAQALILAPTTVLAQQHYYSFKERFAEYPFNIELLSRFRTPQEQAAILAKLSSGQVDIVIGTSSLCNPAIKCKNLGLVVIDEEQRFGVKQKERLRELRAEVDVLTMSATPIPRTLYLAMAGARDLSTLLTAPQERLPVRTIVAPEEDKLIADAINAELSRHGQIYYLHNRVKSIRQCADQLQKLVPECRFAVAHGQMAEGELEEVMADFQAGRIDCLVCSTIIESGLDIPNANTIIIERADHFGLAELYQLRGRVGRWKHQAYAYMLLPRNLLVTGDGRKRIAAIRRCSNLGAGFQLALRDLEIRGSGNILGAEQSGHLNAVGFELYCQILKQEVAKLTNREVPNLPEPELAIDFVVYGTQAPENYWCAGIPKSYIESDRLRIGVYRKVASLTSEAELADLVTELRDRFGKLPEVTVNLIELARVRILAGQGGFDTVSLVAGKLLLQKGRTPYREHGLLPVISYLNTPALRIKLLQKVLRNALASQH